MKKVTAFKMIILSSYLLPKMQPLVLSYTCACVTENIRLR